MSQHIILSENLTFKYPNSELFNFRDIQINKNEHTLLLGDSGSGKTTLLNLLSGLSQPTAGKVVIDSQNIYALKENKLDLFRAQKIGFIFQEAHLLKNLNILENIQLAQYLAKKPKDDDKIFKILDHLQLSNKYKNKPHELSRGQMQRVAIARALINNPAIVIADEPTAALDDQNTNKVIDLLLETTQNFGATLLIATHDKRIKDNFKNYYQL